MKQETNTYEPHPVELEPSLAASVIYLHEIGQKTSVEVLKAISDNPKASLIIGWMQGIQRIGLQTLHVYLIQVNGTLSIEEAESIFRFIEKLLDGLREENAKEKFSNIL